MTPKMYSMTQRNGRAINLDKPVRVCRNLKAQKRGQAAVYSVQQNGCVLAHATALMLTGCTFVVDGRGRPWVQGMVARQGAMGTDPREHSLPVKLLGTASDFETMGHTPKMRRVKGATAVCLNHEGVSAAYLNG